MSTGSCSSVGVVGAGIQGVCIGLQLLKKDISKELRLNWGLKGVIPLKLEMLILILFQ